MTRKAHDARKVGNWVAFAFTAPYAVLTWLIGGLSIILFVARKPRFEGAGILTLEFREWFAKGRDGKGLWRYSTTLGRTIWWQPGVRTLEAFQGPDGSVSLEARELDERLERHEREHIWQIEDLMLLSFAVGLVVGIGHWAHGNAAAGFGWWFALWVSGGLWQLPNFLTAWMRFGFRNAYRDSSHERHAFAATDHWPDGQSWYDRREEKR